MSLKPQTLQQQFKLASVTMPRDLGDGLILRIAMLKDTEPLAQFSGRVFGRDHIEEMALLYSRDMMRESHPIIGPGNVLIVEDTRAEGKIVSSMILIPQTWTYAGIPFGVGRPEMVVTDPNYRRRGLIRKQFEVLHAMSEAMGHVLQGITGIPWYYRQFGYEYALDLEGGRVVPFSAIPVLKENESEPYRLRNMTNADIPFASTLYDREIKRSLVACPRSEELWHYMLTPLPESMAWRVPYQIIETQDGRAVGYMIASRDIWNDVVPINELVVSEEQSLRAAMPTILRWTRDLGQIEATKQTKTLKGIYLALGREHAAYDTIPDMLPTPRIPYGWYIRIADVCKFIQIIAPALEERLAHSGIAGYSGELKISEYRYGHKLVFENGKLVKAEPWQPTPGEEGDCGFPPLVFLQLLLGRKSLAELRDAFPDVWAKGESTVLLNALFPKAYSCVYFVS